MMQCSELWSSNLGKNVVRAPYPGIMGAIGLL